MTEPAWQRGYPLAELRPLAERFRAAEGERPLGLFSRVTEAWIAERLAGARLLISGACIAALRYPRRETLLEGYARRSVARLPARVAIIERACIEDPAEAALLLAPLHPSALLALLPDPSAAALAELLALQPVPSKVTAAGEILGAWARFPRERLPARLEHNAIRLPLSLDVGELRAQLPPEGWAQHYSSYNKRRSWTALALRGFGGPEMVEKPAEMSRGWRDLHPEALSRPCADTELRARMPALEPILDQLGSPRCERIRIMRLAPGGELTRHADVTDHDAGIGSGRLARIHIPLITEPAVEFRLWRLDGSEERLHMRVGEAWALDHAKPHAVVNPSGAERIHLVVDAWVFGRLDALLG